MAFTLKKKKLFKKDFNNNFLPHFGRLSNLLYVKWIAQFTCGRLSKSYLFIHFTHDRWQWHSAVLDPRWKNPATLTNGKSHQNGKSDWIRTRVVQTHTHIHTFCGYAIISTIKMHYVFEIYKSDAVVQCRTKSPFLKDCKFYFGAFRRKPKKIHFTERITSRKKIFPTDNTIIQRPLSEL